MVTSETKETQTETKKGNRVARIIWNAVLYGVLLLIAVVFIFALMNR